MSPSVGSVRRWGTASSPERLPAWLRSAHGSGGSGDGARSSVDASILTDAHRQNRWQMGRKTVGNGESYGKSLSTTAGKPDDYVSTPACHSALRPDASSRT